MHKLVCQPVHTLSSVLSMSRHHQRQPFKPKCWEFKGCSWVTSCSLQALVDTGTYYWLFNMPVALSFTGELFWSFGLISMLYICASCPGQDHALTPCSCLPVIIVSSLAARLINQTAAKQCWLSEPDLGSVCPSPCVSGKLHFSACLAALSRHSLLPCLIQLYIYRCCDFQEAWAS